MSDPRQIAEATARASYGRLVAMLASRSRDLAAAEDALADAFAAALRVWPTRGVPDNPEAWLWTAARRNLGHVDRGRRVRELAHDALVPVADEPASFPDRRLALLFVCAHPAIDEAVRTPLMLQVVLGLDAARIGAAFLVPPATMGQRLVRAKAKIRDAGVPFETPDPEHLAARLDDVLSAIYAAFGLSWEAPGADPSDRGLADEALYLGRLVAELLPDEPEPQGLVALMAYCASRRDARRDADGRFVPLSEQDPRRWTRALWIEAEQRLTQASRAGRFGRFQCEAALQSVHHQERLTGVPLPEASVRLYDLLVARAPSAGAWVGRAAAVGRARGPAAGLAALDALEASCSGYQPYWATRLHLLTALGRAAEAEAARAQALALTTDPAVRGFLGG